MILINFIQLENTFDSIEVTDGGISISVNEMHLSKRLFSMVAICDDMMIVFNLEQSLNEHSPIDSTDEGIVIFSRYEQLLKTFFQIDFIDDGIIILLIDEHPQKTLSSIVTKEEGISKDILHLSRKQNAF